VTVSFPHNLIAFRPRVTAANLTPDVEVRVWDPLQMQAFAEQSTLPAGDAVSPSVLGARFGEGGAAGAAAGTAASDLSTVVAASASASASAPGPAASVLGGPLGSLGPQPSPTAYVVNDRPVATGLAIATAGHGAATALGADLGGTFAEAEGDAFGNPAIQPGTRLTVTGTQYPFDGDWLVSHARHVFDDEEHGYRTTFAATGRQDRSMLGLTSLGGGRRQHRATLDGLVCGVVSNVLDPLGRARVKVTLPWLSPDFETDWAPVGQGCAGPSAGSLFLPAVGDEVVLAFEYGDPRRPYVLGSVVNNHTAWSLQTGGGPGAALASLAGGLGGMGGQLASAAGTLQSLVGDIASLTVAGQILGATGMAPPSMSGSPGNIGSDTQNLAGSLYGLSTPGQAANMVGIAPPPGLSGNQAPPGMSGVGTSGTAAAGAQSGLGAVQESPGMVGEVVRRGYVSATGNVLVFDDEPLSPTGTGTGGLGAAMGGAAAGPPLTSSITLGAQNGTHGLYVDQVASTVLLQSNATPGVSMSQTPLLVISAGATGSVIINAGTDVTIASEKALTLMAPEIMIAGETVTVVGELIPLTPG
jgi:hypothetical protein